MRTRDALWFSLARTLRPQISAAESVHLCGSTQPRSALEAMVALTDNFTGLCLAAPHISARAPALREVISLFRILGKRDVEAHPG
jgi:hypothetical protein